MKALAELLKDREPLGRACDLMLEELGSCKELAIQIDDTERQLVMVSELLERTVAGRAAGDIGHTEFIRNKGQYDARIEELKGELDRLLLQKLERQVKAKAIKHFRSKVLENELVLDSFDEYLWTGIVEKVAVLEDGGLEFWFVNGSMIRV